MNYYVCSDGDVLDAIVSGHYGTTAGGNVELVLAANPGLPALGAVYPAGTRIALPVIEPSADQDTAQLWG